MFQKMWPKANKEPLELLNYLPFLGGLSHRIQFRLK